MDQQFQNTLFDGTQFDFFDNEIPSANIHAPGMKFGTSNVSIEELEVTPSLDWAGSALVNLDGFQPIILGDSEQVEPSHCVQDQLSSDVPGYRFPDSDSIAASTNGNAMESWAIDMNAYIDPTSTIHIDGQSALATEPLALWNGATYMAQDCSQREQILSDWTATAPFAISSAPASPIMTQSPPIPNMHITDDQRWQATLSRSRAADRSFLYGVLTTKVYCRPSCASRRPSRRHVIFFPFPGAIEAARQARFRPCKRCIPETSGMVNAGVQGVCNVISRVISEAFQPCTGRIRTIKTEDLAKVAGTSTYHFIRIFRATTQMTPGDFMTACSSLALQDALSHKPYQDSEAEIDVNKTIMEIWPWSARTAKKALGGISPTVYAKGAKDQTIKYTSVRSPVGLIQVAFSGKGAVHAVILGDQSEDFTVSQLPTATASEIHAHSLHDCMRRIEMESRDRDTELPADLLPLLWRARIWSKLVHDNVLGV